MTEADKLKKFGAIVCKMNSTKDPDVVWEVRQKDGHYTCNCPSWRFRRTCKHTDYARDHGLQAEPEKPQETTAERGMLERILMAGGYNVKLIATAKLNSMTLKLTEELGGAVVQPSKAAVLTGGVRLITLE